MRRPECFAPCWTLTETDEYTPWQKNYRFDFTVIRSEALRQELQYYLWSQYRSNTKKLSTLRQEYSWLKYYEEWLFRRGIHSLREICRADTEGFLTYLHTCISAKTRRPLRLITQKHIYDTVRGIYRWYAVRKEGYLDAFCLFPADAYQRINRITRTECTSRDEADDFLQLLEQAENPCLRCGGTILAVTGISPGDLLCLRTDCIEKEKTGTFLRYYQHRTRRYRVIPVSEVCVHAVETLREQTDPLRQLVPKEKQKHLFLHCGRSGRVISPDPDLFRYWVRSAQSAVPEAAEGCLQPAEVVNPSGRKEMTPTMLRMALLQDMWERKLPYMVIRELTGYPLFTERGSIA